MALGQRVLQPGAHDDRFDAGTTAACCRFTTPAHGREPLNAYPTVRPGATTTATGRHR